MAVVFITNYPLNYTFYVTLTQVGYHTSKPIKTGLLIFRAVADPRNSGFSAKSREIPKKTRNTVKSARNISKYMSAKHM